MVAHNAGPSAWWLRCHRPWYSSDVLQGECSNQRWIQSTCQTKSPLFVHFVGNLRLSRIRDARAVVQSFGTKTERTSTWTQEEVTFGFAKFTTSMRFGWFGFRNLWNISVLCWKGVLEIFAIVRETGIQTRHTSAGHASTATLQSTTGAVERQIRIEQQCIGKLATWLVPAPSHDAQR